jgi:hypothetical protein
MAIGPRQRQIIDRLCTEPHSLGALLALDPQPALVHASIKALVRRGLVEVIDRHHRHDTSCMVVLVESDVREAPTRRASRA